MEEYKHELPKKQPVSNAQRQKEYRDRLKAKLGDNEYKKTQNEKLKKYRQAKADLINVEETKLSNKETRTKVNQLLKNIQERVLQMINEQKQNPQIAIHFEEHIKPHEIEPILVQINNNMSNDEVVQAFVQNEKKNPKNPKKTADEGTFRGYLDSIQRLRRYYFGIKDPSIKVYHDFEWLKDTEGVIKVIKERYNNPNTLSTMVNAISATLGRLNHYQDLYINTYKNLNVHYIKEKKQIQLEKENELTPEEKAVFMKWNDILKLEQAVKDTDVNPVENLVIYYLYTQIPPRRVGDYANLVIQNNDFQDDNKGNFVILNKNRNKVNRIILNKYKTSKTYKKYTIEPVPEKLSQSIVDLINEQGYTDGEFLFQNQTGKKYGQTFSARIKKVFLDACGRGITVNVLRHSFISYHLNQLNITYNQKLQWATAMGHSVEMQSIYFRYDKEELGIEENKNEE